MEYSNVRWFDKERTKVAFALDGVDVVAVANPLLTHYANIVQKGVQIADYAPTADDVREEAQRRIIALTGARDLSACIVKQLNAQMRAIWLNDKRLTGGALTPAEEAEAEALRNMSAGVAAIRARSNVLEANPPVDYAADSHWTP